MRSLNTNSLNALVRTLCVAFVLIFAAEANAGLGTTRKPCDAQVYFKKPDTWSGAYLVLGGTSVKMVDDASHPGWFTANTADISSVYQFFYIDNSGKNDCYSTLCATRKSINIMSQNPLADGFSCSDVGISTELWIEEHPNPMKMNEVYVTTHEPREKRFYVLIPDDKDWKSSIPMYTTDGTSASGKSMLVDENMCGWYYIMWLDEKIPDEMVIYRDSDTDLKEAIGLDGYNARKLEPLPLAIMFEFNGNTLYFVPDEADRLNEGDIGVYTEDPMIEGNCTYSLAAIIYDTDASLHGAFTCDAYPNIASNGCYSATAKYNFPGNGAANTVPCIGVTHGIVEPILGADKKPVYNAKSGCFVSQEAFDVMFRPTEGINFQHCRDMKFSLSGDAMWEYDSYNEPLGAYTPLNDLADSAGCTGTCKTAATLRDGKGNIRYGGNSNNNNDENNCGISMTGLNLMTDYVGTKGCITKLAQQTIGSVPANWSSINPKTGLPYIDSYPAQQGEFASGTNPDVYDGESWNARIESKNNQMFCFESHATFTYRPGMQFAFRGDDDIWVFIGNRLAVDLGGTHLAAPGYVSLDTAKDASGAALVSGNDYPIDIFFCDRRTDMSNVRIKTNMYIKQTTGTNVRGAVETPTGLALNICYKKTGDNSCAAMASGSSTEDVELCGDEIATITQSPVKYYIQTLKKLPVNGCSDCDNLPVGQKVHGGIDLTNPYVPVVDKEHITGLPPGNYYLMVEIDGKADKFKFRIAGNLDVVNSDVTFINTDEEDAAYPTGTQWKYEDKALAGTRIPLYISAPDEQGGIDLISAVGQNYTLTVEGASVLVYKNKDDEQPLSSLSGTIGPTGVDTLWVTIPLQTLGTEALKTCKFKVRSNEATFSFYAPTIQFAEPASKDPTTGEILTWNPMAGDPDMCDGEECFHWVGEEVPLYIIGTNPITNSLCVGDGCDFTIDVVDNSKGVSDNGTPVIVNGVASFSIKSTEEFVPPNAAYITVQSTANPSITATYGNMHFYKPPAPMPILADIFDTRGATIGKMEIPSPYYAEDQEYLDGRGDSIAITYEREIHPDSVPTFICVNFDEEHAEKYNPYKMGISSYPKDTVLYCSQTFSAEAIKAGYESGNHFTIGLRADSAFSAKVKTVVKPENKIYSFTEYMWKGQSVKASFDRVMTDRIAPIIVSARVEAESEGSSYDRLTVVFSEPVSVNENYQREGFQFYLNSATELSTSARYRASESQNGPTAKTDTVKVRYENSNAQKPSPHVGDYIRFRAALGEAVWTDTTNLAETASIRPQDDASYNWNSPTDYDIANNKGRLPSPWVSIEGAAEVSDASINIASSDPAKAKEPAFMVNFVPSNWNLDSVKVNFPNTLGKFLKTDMKSLWKSKDVYAGVKPEDVYFYYEVDVFTNLGNFVIHKDEKIMCNDENYFGKGNTCFSENKNLYISWNMTSAANHRLVGSGAYIVKWSSYVHLGEFGKQNKLPHKDDPEVWGVRHGKKKK